MGHRAVRASDVPGFRFGTATCGRTGLSFLTLLWLCAALPPKLALAAEGCGNGTIEGSEQCDDGNVADSDGCTAACAVEAGYAAGIKVMADKVGASFGSAVLTKASDAKQTFQVAAPATVRGLDVLYNVCVGRVGVVVRLRLFDDQAPIAEGTLTLGEGFQFALGELNPACYTGNPPKIALEPNAARKRFSFASSVALTPGKTYRFEIAPMVPEDGRCTDFVCDAGDPAKLAQPCLTHSDCSAFYADLYTSTSNPDGPLSSGAFFHSGAEFPTTDAAFALVASYCAAGSPTSTEACSDSVDNDCDGKLDCADADCQCCQPDCSAKTCGDDGCGGTCGACITPETCSPAGQCEPPLLTCGNGALTVTEECDDGNSKSGDGCSATCAIESAYSCQTEMKIATGLDAQGQHLPQGSVDARWSYSTSLSGPWLPAKVATNCAPGFWYEPGAAACQWVNQNGASGGTCNNSPSDQTTYYRTTFNLTSASQAAATRLAGSLWADNTVVDVFVNGISTGVTGGDYQTATSLPSISPKLFTAGDNTLIVAVKNAACPGCGLNPDGLLLCAANPGAVASTCRLACGDGALAAGEECDDGNAQSGDGCSAACKKECNCTGKTCGDNGCGGTCGSCSAPETCSPAGTCECVPNCTGKTCGDGGCGWSCGDCGPGTVCSAAGQCVCSPSCNGKQCGDDGCGGSCGTCPSKKFCHPTGICTCIPTCTDKQCGDDGCGGSCGTCGLGGTCSTLGRCECAPNCNGKVCGLDGCGGLCGMCPSGKGCDPSGQCVCAPVCGSKQCGPDSCGGLCGNCPAAHECNTSGLCVPKAGAVSKLFVTSAAVRGNFGASTPSGAATADVTCQAEATAAGLAGRYKAWLSDKATYVTSRLFLDSALPFVLPSGAVVADNLADLLDGSIKIAINQKANGTVVPSYYRYWTGGNGTTFSHTCAGWTDMWGIACTGDANTTGATWSGCTLEGCDGSHHFLCVQQKVCVPSCTTASGGVRPCGDDGCGGTCGTCAYGTYCSDDSTACLQNVCAGGIPPIGCCDGGTVKRCVKGQLQQSDCKAAGYGGCGWVGLEDRYSCGGAVLNWAAPDPSGKFVRACPGTAEYACEGKVCGWFDGSGRPSASGTGFDCAAANGVKQATSCNADQRCDTALGKCVCAPKCDGKSCGSDGCGGTCGTCALNVDCTANGKCGCGSDADCGAGKLCVGSRCREKGTLCGQLQTAFGDPQGVQEGGKRAEYRNVCRGMSYSGLLERWQRSYAVTSTGKLEPFGVNSSQVAFLGQLPAGAATGTTDLYGIVDAASLSDVVQCAYGLKHLVVLHSDGRVSERTSADASGALPTDADGSAVRVTKLVSTLSPTGNEIFGALRANGTVRFWASGVLPSELATLDAGTNNTLLALGTHAALLVKTDGSVKYVPFSGQAESCSDVKVPTLSGSFIDAEVSGCAVIMLLSSGDVMTWGRFPGGGTLPNRPAGLPLALDIAVTTTSWAGAFAALDIHGRVWRWPTTIQDPNANDPQDKWLFFRWTEGLTRVTRLGEDFALRCGSGTTCGAVSSVGCCAGAKRYRCGAFGELAATDCSDGCGADAASASYVCGGTTDPTALTSIAPRSCVCIPNCTGNPCGPDGCGGYCSAEGAACNDGNACTIGEACQSGSCVPKSTSPCTDSNVCTTDACADVAGVATCQYSPVPDGLACSDSSPCTVPDRCTSGQCAPGPRVVCDDRNPCTSDYCMDAPAYKASEFGCHYSTDYSLSGSACDDGNACTLGTTCSSGACQGGAVTPCDDGNPCTTDSCSPTVGCLHTATAQGAACDDRSNCTSNDACTNGRCVGQGAVSCDDGNPCTQDPCVAGGCAPKLYVASGTPCTDGDSCHASGTCQQGACSTSPLTCDDKNPCTTDVCTAGLGCTHNAVTGSCNDGNPCTTSDICSGTTCAGTPVSCDDGNSCTTDSCSIAAATLTASDVMQAICRNTPSADGTTCGASTSLCFTGGTCSAGACANLVPRVCNDANPCTDDYCDPKKGCSASSHTRQCDDGNGCTLGDHCVSGACQAGTGQKCQDDSPCTTDACDPAIGCTYANNPAGACNDGDPCTAGDACAGGKCTPGQPKVCNDNNVCTADACVTGQGCVFTPKLAAVCDDGEPCTTSDVCVGATCTGSQKACDDGNPCTTDSCAAGVGCRTAPKTAAACDDGEACTTSDACTSTGTCAGVTLTCDDTNPCTSDYCQSWVQDSRGNAVPGGCRHSYQYGVPCNDGNPCTTDSCEFGACVGTGVCGSGAGSCQCLVVAGQASVTCLTGTVKRPKSYPPGSYVCCTPNCANRACGDDGCGGSCGSCTNEETCENQFQGYVLVGTACAPKIPCYGAAGPLGSCCAGNSVKTCTSNKTIETRDCGSAACGFNGQGFSGQKFTCNFWPSQATPVGTIAACPGTTCTPKCSGSVCGPDGCGGVCGTCPGGQHCWRNGNVGKCVWPCEGEGTVAGCARPTPGAPGSTTLNYCPSATISTLTSANVTQVSCPIGKPVVLQGTQYVCGDGSAPGMEPPACPTTCSCGVGSARRTCGDDGCGTSCGSCPAGQTCNQGACCTPSCAGKTCGSDGCGGTCGTCAKWSTCANGQCAPDAGASCQGLCNGTAPVGCSCKPSCVASGTCCFDYDALCVCKPACTGKECGPDGCGGSCGTCAGGKGCAFGGTCSAQICVHPAGTYVDIAGNNIIGSEGACTSTGHAVFCSANGLADVDCGAKGLACGDDTRFDVWNDMRYQDKTCVQKPGTTPLRQVECPSWGRCARHVAPAGGNVDWSCDCNPLCIATGTCCPGFDWQPPTSPSTPADPVSCGAEAVAATCGNGLCQPFGGETASTCPLDCASPPVAAGLLDAPYSQRIDNRGQPGAAAVYSVPPGIDVRPGLPPVPMGGLVSWIRSKDVDLVDPRTSVRELGLRVCDPATCAADDNTCFDSPYPCTQKAANVVTLTDGATGPAFSTRTGTTPSFSYLRVVPDAPFPAPASYGKRTRGGFSVAAFVRVPAENDAWPTAIASGSRILSTGQDGMQSSVTERCVLARPGDPGVHLGDTGQIVDVFTYFGSFGALPPLADGGAIRDCAAIRGLARPYTCQTNFDALALTSCKGRLFCKIDLAGLVGAGSGCPTFSNSRALVRIVSGEFRPIQRLNLFTRSMASGGQLRLQRLGDGAGEDWAIETKDPLPRGQWAHVAVTFEPVKAMPEGGAQVGRATLYVNGQLTGEAYPVTVDPMWAWSWGVASVGTASDQPALETRSFTGSAAVPGRTGPHWWNPVGAVADFGDAMVYTRALSLAEVGHLAGRGARSPARVWPPVSASELVRNQLWTTGGDASVTSVDVPWLRDPSRSDAENTVVLKSDYDGIRVAPGASVAYPAGGADLDAVGEWSVVGWLRAPTLTPQTVLAELKQGASSRVRISTTAATVCGGKGLVATFPDGTEVTSTTCDHVLAAGEWFFVGVAADGSQRILSIDGAAHVKLVGPNVAAPLLFSSGAPGVRQLVQTSAADLGWAALIPKRLTPTDLASYRMTGPDVWLDGAVGGVAGLPSGTPRDFANFHNNSAAGPTDRPEARQGTAGSPIPDGTQNFRAAGGGQGFIRLPAKGRLSLAAATVTSSGGAAAAPTATRPFTIGERVHVDRSAGANVDLKYRLFEVAASGAARAWATLSCESNHFSCRVFVSHRAPDGVVKRYVTPWFDVRAAPGASADLDIVVTIQDSAAPRLAVTPMDAGVGLVAAGGGGKRYGADEPWNVTAVEYTIPPGAEGTIGDGAPSFDAADGDAIFIPGRTSVGAAASGIVRDVRVYGRALSFGQHAQAGRQSCVALGCGESGRECLAAASPVGNAACGACLAGRIERAGACVRLQAFRERCSADAECLTGLCAQGRCAEPGPSALCASECLKAGRVCAGVSSPKPRMSCPSGYYCKSGPRGTDAYGTNYPYACQIWQAPDAACSLDAKSGLWRCVSTNGFTFEGETELAAKNKSFNQYGCLPFTAADAQAVAADRHQCTACERDFVEGGGDACLWAPKLADGTFCDRDTQCTSGACVEREQPKYAVTSDGCNKADPNANVPWDTSATCAKAVTATQTVKVCASKTAVGCTNLNMAARKVQDKKRWDGTTSDAFVCDGCLVVPYQGQNFYRRAWSQLSPQGCETIFRNYKDLFTSWEEYVWMVPSWGIRVGNRFYAHTSPGLISNATPFGGSAGLSGSLLYNRRYQGPYGYPLYYVEDNDLSHLRVLLSKDPDPTAPLQPSQLSALQKAGAGNDALGFGFFRPLGACNPVLGVSGTYFDPAFNVPACVETLYPNGTPCPPENLKTDPAWARPYAGKMCDSAFCSADTHTCEVGVVSVEKSNGKARSDDKKSNDKDGSFPISLIQNHGSMFRFDRTPLKKTAPTLQLTAGDSRHYVLEAHAQDGMTVFGSAPMYALDFTTELDATPGLRPPKKGGAVPGNGTYGKPATFQQRLAVFGFEISMPVKVSSQPSWPGPIPKVPPYPNSGGCSGPQFSNGEMSNDVECTPKHKPIATATKNNTTSATKTGTKNDLLAAEQNFVDTGSLELLAIDIPIPGQDCPKTEGLALVPPRACFKKKFVGPFGIPGELSAKVEPKVGVSFGAVIDTKTFDPGFRVRPSFGVAVTVKANVGFNIGPFAAKAGVKAAITIIEIAIPVEIGLAFKQVMETVEKTVAGVITKAQSVVQDMWVIKDVVKVKLELTFLKLALGLFFEIDLKLFALEIEQVLFEFAGIKLTFNLSENLFTAHNVDFLWDGLTGLSKKGTLKMTEGP